ncbi:MAG: ATP-binding cassette domain-containing protein [Candidatus Caldarchaeum sp.]|nr:ATP-binding cassette domain-containing protein [Candidatus Caldarchaeum sp.]MDW8063727.1 ATP-binding cassette domain-containing protein [Candidatus Caldarchaeum sp.]MDW8435854.1 ATP-binding cassette domain-containing protein [Candidatus Caldarchaeum sp.]
MSFEVRRNQVVGVVGESGSGKSTLGKTIARIYEPDEGRILCDGGDVSHVKGKRLLDYRRKVQIVFQNPYSSLNPRRKVQSIIGDVIRLYGLENEISVHECLEAVGLPKSYSERYPHQMSGGERQRVALARVLALRPSLIIADEITSSLDVSTQMQILKLLKEVREGYGLSILFISHDVAVVNYISDKVLVMYGGKIVEEGLAGEVVKNPLHPYSQSLIESVPDPFIGWNPRIPDFDEEKKSVGCIYSSRCPFASEKCFARHPDFVNRGDSHRIACYLYG